MYNRRIFLPSRAHCGRFTSKMSPSGKFQRSGGPIRLRFRCTPCGGRSIDESIRNGYGSRFPSFPLYSPNPVPPQGKGKFVFYTPKNPCIGSKRFVNESEFRNRIKIAYDGRGLEKMRNHVYKNANFPVTRKTH